MNVCTDVFQIYQINFVLSFLLRDWQWPKLELKVQSLPEQRYHLGRKNYHVTKMYAVKGQNCQNEHCNFPWTTPVFKDRQKLVLLKENTMMFLLLSIWNPFIFKDYFAQVFIIKSPKLIFWWLHIPIIVVVVSHFWKNSTKWSRNSQAQLC